MEPGEVRLIVAYRIREIRQGGRRTTSGIRDERGGVREAEDRLDVEVAFNSYAVYELSLVLWRLLKCTAVDRDLFERFGGRDSFRSVLL